MIQLGDEFLDGLGLDELSRDEKDEILQRFGGILESRVTRRLAETMSDAQFAEFQQFDLDTPKGSADAEEWLRLARPDYSILIAEELGQLKLKLASELKHTQ